MPHFKALAFLSLWIIENPILEIQVQESIGEFEARSCRVWFNGCKSQTSENETIKNTPYIRDFWVNIIW